ncbi:BRO family protein [Desulfovibrio piger]|uniref:BRO family protein n=1 Tax=Desulfovibrio piger TaxID=901 RepID=UPI003C6CBEEA
MPCAPPKGCTVPRAALILLPESSKGAVLPTPHPARRQPPRPADAEGQPWFVARDVALALEYADPSRAVVEIGE